MDYLAAETAAKDALHLSRASGHLRGEFAAVIDLAHVWIRLGRFDEAALMLRRASNMCDLSPRCRDCVRDGIAQLELNTGNLRSSRLLVEQVLASGARPHAYARLWSALTKSEMLLRQGLYEDCRDQCIGALDAMPRHVDKGLSLRLRLTLAEAFARSGAFSEAGHVAASARRDVGDASAGLLAEVNHRIAGILALGGFAFQAQALAERANRLSSALGARPDVPRHAEHPGPRGSVGVSQEPESRIRNAFGRILDRTAAIFEQAMHPDCAALEVGHLLRDLACCSRWAIVQLRGPSPAVLDASHPFSPVELAEFTVNRTTLVTDLPGSRGTQIRVIAEPVPSLEAIGTLSRLVRIVQYSSGHSKSSALTDKREFPISPEGAGMAKVLQLARRIAETDVPVFLLGETGVGKEWLARRIHEWSKRTVTRFVGFNCAAVSREMLEAQLFGHRRGSFTGAIEGSVGVIRAAEGGTVLLDEIAETSLECQAKLLRFLETGEVHAVGDVVPKKASVRVIAATNRRLEELRSVGVMRPDLFYRLSVLRIEIPALRHRKGEILPIAEDSLAEFARQFGKAPLTLSADCREALICCDWPGNVRQLVNEVRRAAALANAGGTITSRDLSEDVGGSSSTSTSGPPQPHVEISLNQPLSNAIEELQRASITHAIRLCDGRREQVAALLGLSRKGLYLKCLRLGLEAESRATDL